MDTGCIFDNHRGIYMGEAIIELAEEWGMKYETDRTPDSEFYFEAIESAEYYLNKFVAEDGYMFGFGPCGDFMYMPISWWSEE